MLAAESESGYAALARLGEADARARRGDITGAVLTYDLLAGDSSIDPLYRDLGALLAAQRLVDRAPVAEVNQRLASLLAGHSPWRPLAAELSAIAEMRAGNEEAARALFAELVSDPAAPLGLRQRAAEMLTNLGGDLEAALAGGASSAAGDDDDTSGAAGEAAGMTHVLPRGIARGAALLGLCLALGLGGCDTVSDLFDDSDEAPLAGDRLSVISLERQLEPDPGADLLTVRLPPPYVNEDWPQAGGYPHHAMHHLAAADVLAEAWRVRIGRGTDDDGPALSPPVIAGGRVFTMDSRSLISAFDATTGARLWTADTRPEDDDEGAFGGGLALAGGWLFAATGLGHVLALDAETGAMQWRQPIGVPVRAAPVISGGRVFAVSHDNRLWALMPAAAPCSGAMPGSRRAPVFSAGRALRWMAASSSRPFRPES